MGSSPHLYAELFSDPIYQQTVVNTLLFLAFGVNLKLFLALLLSGFFMRPGWWTKALLMVFVLPWAVPALPTFISIHWMLNGEWGLLNNTLYILFGIEGPSWLNERWLALGFGDLFACLEMVAVLDRDPARRQNVDLAGYLRRRQGRWRDRAAPLHPCHVSAARQPLSDPDLARDDLPARRLQYGHSSSPAAARPIRRMCWRHSAFATPTTWAIRNSAWRRSCRHCR